MFNGPLHWVSRHQKVTARSSSEAEIYATDKCVKAILHLQHLIDDTKTTRIFIPTSSSIEVFNYNNACICWSKSTTTKGLRHMLIRENAIRESVQNKIVFLHHIDGLFDIADIFTKELKDTATFTKI